MAEKRINEYEVIFKHVKNNKGELLEDQSIGFHFENHDDVFKIIEILSEKDLFKEKTQTLQFAVGLKLLGDIIMKNRDMELFSEMQPAFVAFMKKLKAKE